MLTLADCPHRAGTPEANEWIRNVYIPTVAPERTAIDRQRYGAASIGGRLIDPAQERATAAAIELVEEAARKIAEAFERMLQSFDVADLLELLADAKAACVRHTIASQRHRRHR